MNEICRQFWTELWGTYNKFYDDFSLFLSTRERGWDQSLNFEDLGKSV